MRTLVAPGTAAVDHIPLCEFCMDEGVKLKAEYEFYDRNRLYKTGCRPHWARNRYKPELGTGFAVRLVQK